MPVDDPLSSIQYLNESDERSRSPLWRYAKDAIALISAVVPPLAMSLGLSGHPKSGQWRSLQNRPMKKQSGQAIVLPCRADFSKV
jgi:hypothetical protein